jgi:sulfur carrier protein
LNGIGRGKPVKWGSIDCTRAVSTGKVCRDHSIPLFERPALISVTVNGETRQFPQPVNCATLIAALQLTGKRVALECNGEIVPRGRHAEHMLADGDKIEIVAAVGGG